MQVKLVGYTQPSEEFIEDFKACKDLVAYCARVSNPSNQNNTETSDKLLKYLIKHKHWSPFEMASITLEVQTTRDIARQMLRHRSFSFQEYSQRYANPVEDLEFDFREARFQDQKNRQNSVDVDMTNPAQKEIYKEWFARQSQVVELVKKHYEWAVGSGIAKEQARCILPEGNTISRLYVQGTIRSFIHYMEVRTDPSTQKEHRELALRIGEVIAEVFDYKSLSNDNSK